MSKGSKPVIKTVFCVFIDSALIWWKESNIPVIFQVASLLAALTHPGHIVIYAPGDSLPCRRDAP
ncbi:hypothetical protein C5468_20155 [Photorhabdus luminescens subsp. mexicana]|uniref:Uncharacterized protein n=1 Tax=Photorhabdus luminescens subsp. mexicana TaxID=2100167 RepID=A0A4R4IYC5_PHOLU|nr:hypothetical protein C5468_20155 [Photorhabdus luminescens subsp. mexicana]